MGEEEEGLLAGCCKWATNFLDAWMEMVQIMFDVSKRKFEKKPKKEKKKKKQKEARHSLKVGAVPFAIVLNRQDAHRGRNDSKGTPQAS